MTDFVVHDIVDFATWLYSFDDPSEERKVILDNQNAVEMIESIKLYLQYKGDHELIEAVPTDVGGTRWSLTIQRELKVQVTLVEDE